MKEYKYLNVRFEGHVGVVELNNAPVNTITFEFLDEIGDVFRDLADDKNVWAVVLYSGLKVFISGADVSNLASVDRYGNAYTSRRFQEVYSVIERFPHPVICAVNGVAFGGGLELALCCDLRVFGGKAKVGFPEVGLGIIPCAGGTQRLPKLVGTGVAKRLIYSAETVRADEAYRIGLCEFLTEPGEEVAKAIEVAQTICTKSPESVAAVKKCIDYAAEHGVYDGLDYERFVGGDVFDTEDRTEGTTAFLEKRPAVFKNQ